MADVLVQEPRTSRWRMAAVVATALAVVAAVAVPVWLARDGSGTPPAAAPAPPAGPPAQATIVPVESVVAAGEQINVLLYKGVCDAPAVGRAVLIGGRWQLTVWRPPAGRSSTRVCIDIAQAETVRVPLPEPYRGQPVVDGTGRTVPVNGGPGFLLPTYLPDGYRITPGGKGGLTLAGPYGAIVLSEGGPEVGTVRPTPGFEFDVLSRPDIAGNPGTLIRYRKESGNTVLRWRIGDKGLSLQVFSTTLNPDELVRIARGIS
jgi:hypothetical protein